MSTDLEIVEGLILRSVREVKVDTLSSVEGNPSGRLFLNENITSGTRFGEGSIFIRCHFGMYCSFWENCVFLDCEFGEHCEFGDRVTFHGANVLGMGYSLGHDCETSGIV